MIASTLVITDNNKYNRYEVKLKTNNDEWFNKLVNKDNTMYDNVIIPYI